MVGEERCLAETDYLTGLANRRGLHKYYNNLNKNEKIHAMFIDIDNFKRVNDIYGHSMGDRLLVSISQLIKDVTPGFTSRIGGDEFIIIFDGKKSEQELAGIARRLLDSIKELKFRKDVLSHISLSAGIVMNQKAKTSIDDVLHRGDVAMYQAKYDGKNCYVFYHEYDETEERNKNIELEMEEALKSGQFKVYLQPKINMVTSKLYGAEALSRWIHPVDGLRGPNMYIPVFEKNGFISKLDMYMFEQVCKLKSEWRACGEGYSDILISVNMSRLHLYDENFGATLVAIADKYKIPHNELEIEITESIFMKDTKELVYNIEMIKELGFLVSIDDFGSGFSALNILKDLAVDIIKIDREFLNDIGATSRGKMIIKNVIAMCLDLKVEVVTEGIETKEQVEFIKRCGCQIAQGFYYSRPIDIQEFEKFARKHMVPVLDRYIFHLNGDLQSEDGSLEGNIDGEGLEYREGLYKDSKSLYFPGGEIGKNIVNIPPEVIVNDNYTVGLWIKPETLHLWVCSLYIKFDIGFSAILPLGWEGVSDFRIRDSRGAIGWYDAIGPVLKENVWTYVMVIYNAKNETATLCINGEVVGILENVPTNRYVTRIILGGDLFKPSFKGQLCDLVFYNAAKDYEFVKEMYRSYVERDGFLAIHNG